jgi:hypothetical protein
MVTQPRSDWLPRSFVCGYLSSIAVLSVLLTGYLAAIVLGLAGPASWSHGLAYNSLTAHAESAPALALCINFLAGISFALIYGRYVEPRATGPAWRSGVLFAMFPCLLSLVVFFPLVGAGVFGIALGAGPLPIIGNIILHIIYGLSLGLLYGPLLELGIHSKEGPVEKRHSEHGRWVVAGSIRGAAMGLSIGGLTGMVLGALATLQAGTADLSTMHMAAVIPLGTILAGSALGCLAGMVTGQPQLEG